MSDGADAMTTITTAKVGKQCTMPKVGQQVVLHYCRKAVRLGGCPHHGKLAVVIARKTRGSPRNHLVQLADGTLVVTHCGNLRRPVET